MARILLKTLTPVHVGCGVKLQEKTEYIRFGNQIAVLDDVKVLSIIGEENIPTWVSIIEKKDNFLDYLKKRKPGIKASDVALRIIDNPLGHYSGKEIFSQIHTGFGVPYIPGSSLKGAIRTAVFATLAKNNKELVKSEAKRQGGSLHKDDYLQKNLIGSDPNHDPFRLLKVGDIHFSKTEFRELKVANLAKNEGWHFKFSQFIECIPPDAESQFEIRFPEDTLRNTQNSCKTLLQTYMKDSLPYQTLEAKQLFKMINNHTLQAMDLEKDELEMAYHKFEFSDDAYELMHEYRSKLLNLYEEIKDLQNSDKECILRLGFGTGYHSITGAWKKRVLGKEDLMEDKHRFANIYPKTRRLTAEGEPLGFLKLKLI
ncbi:MAG: type III-A CRISPR-associated RAMP protein Csm5 [Bacteroidia bacterium]|nr:type III-A CRISPR-associated RAMP protein Csm5 [Bacteroidia bacterium]